MTNKTLGIGWLITIGVLFLTAILEAGMHPSSSDILYSLSGLGILFFGIWGSARLIK